MHYHIYQMQKIILCYDCINMPLIIQGFALFKQQLSSLDVTSWFTHLIGILIK